MYVRSWLKSFSVGGAALLVLGLGGCSKPAPAPEPVRSVRLITLGSQAVESQLEYAGEVQPRVESRLGFRVAGKVVKRAVALGQAVQAGQVLLQLDGRDYQLSADAARAQLTAATTNRDVAAADWKRYKDLYQQNFISSAELDRREAAYKGALAQYEQAQSQAALQTNQNAYTVLVADVAGVVTGLDAEVGQVVAAGTPVVRIAQTGAVDVVFSVSEDKRAAVQLGAAVQVRPWSGGAPLVGQVRELAASADPVTRTYTVKVGLSAKDALPLGATVAVALEGAARKAQQVLKLPITALLEEGGKSKVWVLDPATMTVAAQPIELAAMDGNAAVVAAGLQPGAQVVVSGVHTLSAGQKVTIYQEPKSAAPAARAPVADKPAGASGAAATVAK